VNVMKWYGTLRTKAIRHPLPSKQNPLFSIWFSIRDTLHIIVSASSARTGDQPDQLADRIGNGEGRRLALHHQPIIEPMLFGDRSNVGRYWLGAWGVGPVCANALTMPSRLSGSARAATFPLASTALRLLALTGGRSRP